MRVLPSRWPAVWVVLALSASPAYADDPEIVVWADGPGYTLSNGDSNGDFERDIGDVVYLFEYLYLGGPEPAQLVEADIENGDANADGFRDLSDGIFLLEWLFLGGPEPRNSLSLRGAGAAATTTIAVLHIPVSPPPQVNPCNGDLVFLYGEATGVQQTVTKPDGSSLYKVVSRWAALRGTGVPSGTEYVATGGAVLVLRDLGPGESTHTVAKNRYITNDGSSNGLVSYLMHVATNANGEVTVDISDISIECTGK